MEKEMDSNKKAIQVTSSSMPPIEEYIQEISTIWDTRWLTHTGPKHQKLEKQLCEYLNVDNVALFTNGHLALEAALEVLGITGEVITTPFTFASTTQSIVRAGLKPVFCDINPNDYTIDVNKIESLITNETSAIMPVHVFGNICDCKAIEDIASRYNLKVIYDAAHAFGITIDGRGVGSFGDVSMFSFHATKVFHTIEGGGLTYSNSNLSKMFAAWRQFGMFGKEDAESIGTNAKMTEFQAAMGLCNLLHIDEQISKRKAAVMRYREKLSDIPGIKLCDEQKGVRHNYAYFPVVFDPFVFRKSRDKVEEDLRKNNIFARKYFYPLTSKFSVIKKMFPIAQTPIAEKIADQVLTLPLYADLELNDVDYICDIILGANL